MKNLIKEGLKTKYSNKGLSEKVFDGVANLLSKTIVSEDQIATGISGAEVEELLTSFQSEFDKIRLEKSNLEKEIEALKKVGPADPTPPPPGADPGKKDAPVAIDFASIEAMVAKALTPVVEKLSAFDNAKKRDNLLAEAKLKRDALKLDPKQDPWINDAWNGALSSTSETDTADTIVDRFKTRYNEYMARLGANGYIPQQNGSGAIISDTAKMVKEVLGETAPIETAKPEALFAKN